MLYTIIKKNGEMQSFWIALFYFLLFYFINAYMGEKF